MFRFLTVVKAVVVSLILSGSLVAQILDWEDFPDFSHAGYGGGGVELPNVPVRETVSPGSGDDTALIQDALDRVGALPMQSDGFRGAVLLAPGTYQVTEELRMDQSGVVLRGSGESQTVLQYDGPGGNGQVIRVGGVFDDNWETQVAGSLRSISSNYIQTGSYSFNVDGASDFSVGDEIVIWHQAKSAWFELVEQGGVIDDIPWEEQENWRDVRYRRIITRIVDSRITVDAPVFMDLDPAVADLWVYKYDRPEYKERIGIESLTIDIVTESAIDETQVGTGIYFLSLSDSWAKGVTVKHFWSNGFRLSGTVHMTLEDCKAIEPHSEIRATRRYNFVTSAAQLVLFRNCFTSGARHAYSLNGHTSDSGVVFLDCEASYDYGTSGSHQRWVTGLLFDNVEFTNPTDDPPNQALLFGNAGDNGEAHGWTVANGFAWRCDVSQINNRIVLQDPPGPSENYAIACIGEVEGRGGFPGNAGEIVFAEDVVDWPRSLYEAQLERRLLAESDTQAPTTPGNLAISGIANNVVSLDWDDSNDDFGVEYYIIYRNGEWLAESSISEYVDDSLGPGQVYSYSVVAVDLGNNESSASDEETFETGSDLLPPSVPTSLQATALSSLSVELSWGASEDDFAVAYYQVYLNEEPIEQSEETSQVLSGLAPNTAFSLYVVAFDVTGKSSLASDTVNVSTPPSALDSALYLGMPFEESAGTVATDFSVNGFDGTLLEGVARTSEGRYGKALQFDGIDDRVMLDNIDIPGTAFSITAWIKPSSFNVSDARIVSKANGVAEDDHAWMLSTFSSQGIKARFRLRTESSEGTVTLIGNIELVEGVWTHLAATYDGAEMKLFVNGVLDTKVACRGQVSEFPDMEVAIGDQPQGSRSFHGIIDEVRIYTRSLDAEELTAVMSDSLDNTAGPDFVPPTVPSDVVANRVSETQAEIGWTLSTDNVAVAGYRIYRDNTLVGTTAGNSFTDTELAGDQVYLYEVTAFDGADNESEKSLETTLAVWEVNEPPTVPSDLVAVVLSSSQIKLSWSASQDDGVIDQYRIYRDESFIGASTGLLFTDTDLSSESTHAYKVQAIDNEGLESELSVAIQATTLPDTTPEQVDNAVLNGGFESGLANWTFYTSGVGDAAVSTPSYTGANAAVLSIDASASNIQLYQNGLSLLPNTKYELSFAAYSNTGRDLRISLNKHSSPYTNYGLSRERIDLSTEWQVFTVSFTTQLFSSMVHDGRLYFWLADDARSGDVFYIDQVSLVPLDSHPLIVDVAGEGTVARDPDDDTYGSAQEITLTASPEEGWVFDRWVGDIASAENPLTIQIEEETELLALFLPEGGEPVIDIWYGDNQTFGAVGIPQPQINILGNVQIPSFIESLEYSLNGVNRGELTMGPDANIRHGMAGDFNVEIPYTSLSEGENEIVVVARGIDDTLYSRTITINSSIYKDWPIPYELDWTTLDRIDEAAQVVDGRWELTEGGVRVVESAYDRLIALGDIEWTDYEVTVPVTVHRIDEQGAPQEPLVGVMLRWNGHSQKTAREQPGTEWRPIGAIGAYGWYESGYRGGPRFHILETGTKKSDGYEGMVFPLNETYLFKFKVETPGPQTPGFYSFKAWPEGKTEPVGWGVTRQAEDGLLKGSLMLVAHYVDATFGTVRINPVGEDTRSPTRPTELVAQELENGDVSLIWIESSDESGVAYYRVLRNGQQLGDSVNNGYLDTTIDKDGSYSYQVLAYDEFGNVSEPSELVTVKKGSPVELSADLWLGMGFEESSGALVEDLSIHENHGELYPEASRATDGKFGAAIRFNGLAGRVDLGSLDIPSDVLTVAAWINANTFATVDSRILSKATGVNEGDHYWMLSSINSGGIKARVRLKTSSGDTVTLIGSTTLPVGQWTHLAFTYDGNELLLYVDGVLDGSMSLTGGLARSATVPAAIGDQPQGSRSFDGLIDEVQIYSKALSIGEIATVMETPLSREVGGDTEAPSVPTGVSVELVGESEVQVFWDASSDDNAVVAYRIYRNNTLVGQMTSTEFSDTDVEVGETYEYAVTAVDSSDNESAKSETATIEISFGEQPPTTPVGVSATGLSASEIQLNWEESTDDDAVVLYRIYRDSTFIGTSVTTTFVDAGLAPETNYSYQVAAVDDDSLLSDLSEVVEGSTLAASSPVSVGNAIVNGGFEDGLSDWSFYTSGSGDAAATSPGFAGSRAAVLTINSKASNIQLFQNDVALRPNTKYRLVFSAYSNTGRDFRVSLGKHVAPYTNYGLNREVFDLSTDWETFSFEFETSGFNSEVNDGRLFFWLASDARAGDVFHVDRVVLTPADEGSSVDTESPSKPQNLIATASTGPKVAISWQASTDSQGVSFYRILRNGATLADVSNTTFIDSTVLAGLEYSYQVVAYDAAGNASAPSSSAYVSIGMGSSSGTNVIVNSSFEDGLDEWTFFTNGSGSLDAQSPGYSGAKAAVLSIVTRATNIQMFQNGIELEPDARYRLRFAAYSSSGRDLKVSLGKHSAPYTNYGLNREPFNLTEDWQTFTVEFTTKNLSAIVRHGRLFFWLADDARAGDRYYIDKVELTKL